MNHTQLNDPADKARAASYPSQETKDKVAAFQPHLFVESRSIESLRPYVRSLRKNKHAVEQMVAAIQEFGLKISILIRGNGEVVDGHLRLKAAKKLGMHQVPVILCDEWSEAQVKAFRLLVNRSATWALQGCGASRRFGIQRKDSLRALTN